MLRRTFLPLSVVGAVRGQSPEARADVFAGRYKQALEKLAGVDGPEAVYWRVRALIADKRPAEAKVEAEGGFAKWPDAAPVMTARGMVHFRYGEMPEAEKMFRTGLNSGQAFPYARVGMGAVFEALSMEESARTMTEMAIREAPGDPALMVQMANSARDRKTHLEWLEKAYVLMEPSTDAAKALAAHIEADQAMADRSGAKMDSDYTHYKIPLAAGADQNDARRYVRVSFNGGKPVRLLLDTGASGISITQAAAKKFGLEQLNTENASKLTGVGSDKPRAEHRYRCDRVQIGDLVYSGLSARVAKRITSDDEAGLIGTDVFDDFAITLDFPRKTMSLAPYEGEANPPGAKPIEAKGAAQAGFFRYYRVGHLLLLPTLVGKDRARTLFLIDSGASTNLLSYEFGKDKFFSKRQDRIAISGVQGRVNNVYSASNVELLFAGFRYPNADMLSLETKTNSDNIGIELGGILGMPVLGQLEVTIDYRRGAARFVYKGGK